MTQVKTTNLIGLLVVLVIIAGLLLALSNIAKQKKIISIWTFEECKAAGYPIMESFPEQCMTPDGRSFENSDQRARFDQQQSGIQTNGCAVAGCSSQLCISAAEAAEGGGISTCEFRPEYGCYRKASCEPQANGKCGWTQTDELRTCLQNPPSLDSTVPQGY